MLKAIDVGQPSPGVVIPIQPWGGTTQMFWDSDLGKSIETIAYSLYRLSRTRSWRRAPTRSSTCMRSCRTRTAI